MMLSHQLGRVLLLLCRLTGAYTVTREYSTKVASCTAEIIGPAKCRTYQTCCYAYTPNFYQ